MSKALQCGTMTFSVGEEKDFIHLPFDISKGIEHVQFLKNRIRQSGRLYTIRSYRIRQIELNKSDRIRAALQNKHT